METSENEAMIAPKTSGKRRKSHNSTKSAQKSGSKAVKPRPVVGKKTGKNPDKKTVPGRPFPPGVSGNPAGRPKGRRNTRSMLIELLEAQDARDGNGADCTHARPLALELMATAFAKKRRVPAAVRLNALNHIIDRVDGKIIQPFDHTSGGETMAAPKTTVIATPEFQAQLAAACAQMATEAERNVLNNIPEVIVQPEE